MTFVLKCDPFPVVMNQGCLLSLNRFEDAAPTQGDLAFIWFREGGGGTGLAARGVVRAVSDDNPADIALTIVACAPARPLGKLDLAPYRNAEVPGALPGLARKLYKHGHNKVARLENVEAEFLADRWTVVSDRASRYDPLRNWLAVNDGQEFSLSFEEISAILGNSLPVSAARPQWWANTTKVHTNVQREAWRAAGYDAFLLKDQSRVRFVKTEHPR